MANHSKLVMALRENQEDCLMPIISTCAAAEALPLYREAWPLLRLIRRRCRHYLGLTTALFERADRNGDGKVTAAELAETLDKNGDGVVSEEEFCLALRRAA